MRKKFSLGRLVSWFVFISLPWIMQCVDFVDDGDKDFDIHLSKSLTASVHEYSVPLNGMLGLVDIRWGRDFEKETWHTFEYA